MCLCVYLFPCVFLGVCFNPWMCCYYSFKYSFPYYVFFTFRIPVRHMMNSHIPSFMFLTFFFHFRICVSLSLCISPSHSLLPEWLCFLYSPVNSYVKSGHSVFIRTFLTSPSLTLMCPIQLLICVVLHIFKLDNSYKKLLRLYCHSWILLQLYLFCCSTHWWQLYFVLMTIFYFRMNIWFWFKHYYFYLGILLLFSTGIFNNFKHIYFIALEEPNLLCYNCPLLIFVFLNFEWWVYL